MSAKRREQAYIIYREEVRLTALLEVAMIQVNTDPRRHGVVTILQKLVADSLGVQRDNEAKALDTYMKEL